MVHDLRWNATDASGICSYHLEKFFAGSAPEFLLEYSDETSYQDTLSNDNGDFGGGSGVSYGWRVTAEDCIGNTTGIAFGSGPEIRQEDGSVPEGVSVTPMSFDYAGNWQVSTCTCASGGKQAKTSQRNASLRLKHSYQRGDHFGLVMAQGPGRGKALIKIDGKLVGTVDTYARATPTASSSSTPG